MRGKSTNTLDELGSSSGHPPKVLCLRKVLGQGNFHLGVSAVVTTDPLLAAAGRFRPVNSRSVERLPRLVEPFPKYDCPIREKTSSVFSANITAPRLKASLAVLGTSK